MLPRWQFNACLGLACTKMKVIFILRDRLVWVESFVHVDQQMMMSRIWSIAARLGDAHVAEAKSAPERAFHGRAIGGPNNIEKGISGHWGPLRIRGKW